MKDFGVRFAIGAGLASGFKSTLGVAGREVNGLSATIKGLERSRTKADRFAGLKRGLKSTEEELRQTQAESRRLATELAATAKPTKKLQQDFDRATKKSKKLKTSLAGQKQELQRLRTSLNSAGISTTNLGRDTDQLAKSLDRAKRAQIGLNKVTKAQRANWDRRDNLQGQLMGAAAVGVAVGMPVKLAMDFESAMADVKKVVDFDTPEGFKQMGQDILAMTTSGGIPMAAEGIASIVAAAGQSGLAKGRVELLDFAETAAKMGVAFDVGASEAGKMLADWRSGMALDQEQAVGLADAVNYLSNGMNANAGALGKVIQRQGAVAMSAGLSETQVASLGAALLSGGAGPEMAATALKNLTGALTKGKVATTAQSEAFGALGLDAEEMAGKMQEDAPAAIREVFNALSEAPKAEQNALVSQLFGEESKGAIMPLLANLENLDQAFALTADRTKYTGSMQAEFAERSKTAANALQILKNQATRLGVNVGSILLPPMVGFFNVIGPIIGGVASLANRFPKTSATVIGLGAGVAGLTVATIGLGYAFTFVQGGLLNAQKAWAVMNSRMVLARSATIGMAVAQRGAAVATGNWTAAQWLLNLAMNANPIGLVVGGVLALGIAGVALYKYWQPITAFFGGVWAGIREGIAPVLDAFKPLAPIFSAIGTGVAAIGGWLAKLVGPADSSAEALQKATSAGVIFGKVVGAAIRFAFLPFTTATKVVGWLSEKMGLAKDAKSSLDSEGTGASAPPPQIDKRAPAQQREDLLGARAVTGQQKKGLENTKVPPLAQKTFSPAPAQAPVPAPNVPAAAAQAPAPVPNVPAAAAPGLAARPVTDHQAPVPAPNAPAAAALISAARAITGQKKKGLESTKVPPLAQKTFSPAPAAAAPKVIRQTSAIPTPGQGQRPAQTRGDISLTVSPTIHIGDGGNKGQIMAAVNEAMATSEQRLREMLDKILNGDKRLSYG